MKIPSTPYHLSDHERVFEVVEGDGVVAGIDSAKKCVQDVQRDPAVPHEVQSLIGFALTGEKVPDKGEEFGVGPRPVVERALTQLFSNLGRQTVASTSNKKLNQS